MSNIYETMVECPKCTESQSHEFSLSVSAKGNCFLDLKSPKEEVHCQECGFTFEFFMQGTIDQEDL